MRLNKTRNYAAFQTLGHNRKVNMNRVQKIVNSMKEKRLFTPIIVNEKLQVIDGQHRLKALEILELEVEYYIMHGYKPEDIVRLNENQYNWQRSDYLNYWCNTGEEEYLRLRDYMDKHQLTLEQAVSLTGINGALFKQGKYRFGNQEELEEMAYKYKAILSRWTFAAKRLFAKAFRQIFRNDKFEWERFAHQVTKYGYMVEDSSTTKGFLRGLQALYNFKHRRKVRFVDDL